MVKSVLAGSEIPDTRKLSLRKRARSASGAASRENIKSVATELFTRFGYNGVTFLDIGKILGINHSLVHYHFGTKADLAEEVLIDFAQLGIREHQEIWCDPYRALRDKFIGARERIYRRFIHFNSGGSIERPSGLVSRFALEMESIPPRMQKIVVETRETIETFILDAVRIAVENGELRPDAPGRMITLLISNALFGPTTRYGREFQRLDELFQAVLLTIMRAFGTQPELHIDWPAIPARIRRTPPRRIASEENS